MSKCMYSVKLIMQCIINETESDSYEEMVLLISAVSENEAKEKALKYADEYSESYTGAQGDNIKWKYVGMYGPCETEDPKDGVKEVYFHYFDKDDNILNDLGLMKYGKNT